MIWGVYGSLGHSTGSLEQSTEVYRVYSSLVKYMGSLWQSRAVYRKSTAV